MIAQTAAYRRSSAFKLGWLLHQVHVGSSTAGGQPYGAPRRFVSVRSQWRCRWAGQSWAPSGVLTPPAVGVDLKHVIALACLWPVGHGNRIDPPALAAFQAAYTRHERQVRAVLGSGGQVLRPADDGRTGQINGCSGYVDATNALGLLHVGWNLELASSDVVGRLPDDTWQGSAGLSASAPHQAALDSILLHHDTMSRGRSGVLVSLIPVLATPGMASATSSEPAAAANGGTRRAARHDELRRSATDDWQPRSWDTRRCTTTLQRAMTRTGRRLCGPDRA